MKHLLLLLIILLTCTGIVSAGDIGNDTIYITDDNDFSTGNTESVNDADNQEITDNNTEESTVYDEEDNDIEFNNDD